MLDQRGEIRAGPCEPGTAESATHPTHAKGLRRCGIVREMSDDIDAEIRFNVQRRVGAGADKQHRDVP